MLQVWLEILRCTPFRGRPCIYVFSLGDETKRGAKLGVASYQCSVSIVAFVSPIG